MQAGDVQETAADIDRFVDGSILVTSTTDPDWVPVMKRASAIITDHGGRTSHAAIVSRELGLPAIVGTGNATHLLHDGQEVTVSCAEGDHGYVYAGIAEFEIEEVHLHEVPATRTKVMLNLANPAAAARWWRLPVDGVGLARMEFVINNAIRVHPLALTRFDQLRDEAARDAITKLTRGYEDRTEYFVDKLAMGLSRIAATWYPHPAIVRMSDFKTNEYAELLGGRQFEPHEENPMIGFRGASRYVHPEFRECFALECQAVRKVRDEMGLTNCWIMIPFVRTLGEGRAVIETLAANGLVRGENGLKVIMMCEVPSNALLADEFLDIFDGFSIGSNDLTQLTLGLDRDSAIVAKLFDERDPAVKKLLAMAISAARAKGKYIGICGQGPSDHPDLAQWLMEQGIESVSLNPDTVVDTWLKLAKAKAGGKVA